MPSSKQCNLDVFVAMLTHLHKNKFCSCCLCASKVYIFTQLLEKKKKKTKHTLSQELYISEFELSFQVIGILKWHDWKFKQLFFSVLCHQIKASACKLTKAKTKDHGANKSFPWMEKSKIFWTKSSGYTFIFVSS